jgi:5-methylthioadenosine/S-adenosylhomocysteine deaminase
MKDFDLLIKNGIVLTMNEQNSIIPEGDVCVQGDTIVEIGQSRSRQCDAKVIIDAEGSLVLPGLINGHTHAAMSLFRGLADDLPLMEWLNDYIFPVEKRMDEDFVFAGTQLSCAEMIMSGTTTFCDMYLFEKQVAKAAKEAGMRCLVGEVLYDFPSPNYGSIDKGFEYTEELIQAWDGDPLVSIAVEPHSLFTCAPDLLAQANRMAHQYHIPLILHVAETRNEVQTIRDRYGRSPVEHLHSLGLLGPHLVADHCVHLNSDEVKLLATHAVRVIHNPESNMKLASGIAPLPDMLKEGIAVGLGTDGCASNNNLDLLSEMDMTAKLHKMHSGDTTVLDAQTVVRMATLEGAKALGMDRSVGSLEVGKKADLIIINVNKPHMIPMYDPFSHLVYSAGGNDVTHTIIHGRVVMEKRRLLSMHLEEVISRANGMARRVRSWLS